MSEALLSTREAANRLHRSEQWVRNAARDGDLPALVEPLRGGRTRFRFTVTSIEEYLERHGALASVPSDVSPTRTIRSTAPADAEAAAGESLWIEHYREELTRLRLKVADLERTIDEQFIDLEERDAEIHRLCDLVRRMLPDRAGDQ